MVQKLNPGESIHAFRDMGLGDVLLCTPALRAFKDAHPDCRIFFYTDVPDIIRGLPYIDGVFPSAARPPDSIYMAYDIPPPPRHLSKILGDKLGVHVENIKPDCIVVSESVEKFKREWQKMPRPHIVVQRCAGYWTSNKNWPELHWSRFLNSLSASGIIEVGEIAKGQSTVDLPHYLDLRGKTTLQELAACIKAADILIAPVSGPVHIAAAVGTPAVVIIGGYELPVHASYPGNKAFHTPISCSPCWLREPCSIGRDCLQQILPETIEQAVRELWAAL